MTLQKIVVYYTFNIQKQVVLEKLFSFSKLLGNKLNLQQTMSVNIPDSEIKLIIS